MLPWFKKGDFNHTILYVYCCSPVCQGKNLFWGLFLLIESVLTYWNAIPTNPQKAQSHSEWCEICLLHLNHPLRDGHQAQNHWMMWTLAVTLISHFLGNTMDSSWGKWKTQQVRSYLLFFVTKESQCLEYSVPEYLQIFSGFQGSSRFLADVSC